MRITTYEFKKNKFEINGTMRTAVTGLHAEKRTVEKVS